MPPSATLTQSEFLSSLLDFRAGGSNPTDESVGYCQLSRGLSPPARRLYPSGGEDAKACLYSPENSEELAEGTVS